MEDIENTQETEDTQEQENLEEFKKLVYNYCNQKEENTVLNGLILLMYDDYCASYDATNKNSYLSFTNDGISGTLDTRSIFDKYSNELSVFKRLKTI